MLRKTPQTRYIPLGWTAEHGSKWQREMPVRSGIIDFVLQMPVTLKQLYTVIDRFGAKPPQH